MRLIDADRMVKVIHDVAEQEGRMTPEMEVFIEMLNMMPTAMPNDGVGLFRDYMGLIMAVQDAVDKSRMELSITDIKGMEMLEKFEDILRDLERKGYVTGKGGK